MDNLPPDDILRQEAMRQSEILKIGRMHDAIINHAEDAVPIGSSGESIRDPQNEINSWVIHMRPNDTGMNVEVHNLKPVEVGRTPQRAHSLLEIDTNSLLHTVNEIKEVVPVIGFEPHKRLRIWGMVADQSNAEYLREVQKMNPDALSISYTDYFLSDDGRIAKQCVYSQLGAPYDEKTGGVKVTPFAPGYDVRVLPVTEGDLEVAGRSYKMTLDALSQQ